MNLIEQFMKMGGFKTPQELEAYGEENFFRDFPEAKKLAMGGTPEAFPQIATADQFFSYGVPVPPTYHQNGGTAGPSYNFGAWYLNTPTDQDSSVYSGAYRTYANDPNYAAADYIKSINTGVSPRTPSGEINAEGFRLYDLFTGAAKDALSDNPEALKKATVNETLKILNRKSGGTTGLPNIYPQIQSEQQFFSPVYTNSNNAYEVGGSYQEAFPQAVSFPNKGWGKTNYFMLQSGGTFPPGMPQFTGMLPVMQSGSELAGIDSRAQADMNHYYGTPYPMMAGGQPSLQAGGQPTGTGKDSFYTDKMQNFISKVQNNGQKALMKSIELVDEAPPMSGMRMGGKPMYQANRYQGQVDVNDLAPGSIMLDPNNPNYNANLADYNINALGIFGTPSSGSSAPAAGSNSKPATPKTSAPAAKSKSNTAASAGVSKSTNTKVRTSEELKAEVEAEKKKQESGTTAAGTTGTNNDGTVCFPDGTCFINGTPPGVTIGNTTTTNTTGNTATGWEGWHVETLPDGRRVVVDNAGRAYFDTPYYSGPQYSNYNTQQRANYGNLLDYIPGGGLRRKSANLLLATALAGNDLSQYEVDPRSIVTRRAILPGNRIKSFDLVKKGTSKGPYQTTMPTEPAKTTQVPTIQEPVQINTGNTGSKYGTILSETVGPFPGSVPVDIPGMKSGGPYALPMFQSNIFSGEMPPFDGAVVVNAEANNAQNMYWDTGVNDFMAEQARQVEKEADPFKTVDDRLKMDIKRQGMFANMDPDQMLAGIDSLTGFLQRFRPRQEPMTALDVYGSTQSPVGEGSYMTNAPGMGLHFRPTDGNPNVRGMYAYDLPVTQYGGQPFYYADTYYMTMPTIKNVKKAGAYKFGK